MNVLDVVCPNCAASRHADCSTSSGRPHLSRWLVRATEVRAVELEPQRTESGMTADPSWPAFMEELSIDELISFGDEGERLWRAVKDARAADDQARLHLRRILARGADEARVRIASLKVFAAQERCDDAADAWDIHYTPAGCRRFLASCRVVLGPAGEDYLREWEAA